VNLLGRAENGVGVGDDIEESPVSPRRLTGDVDSASHGPFPSLYADGNGPFS
jgi:hypothetical protein